jgi:hypothetical protein
MDDYLPLVAILALSRNRERGGELARATLPAMAPMPTAQRVAFTAVMANDNVTRSRRREERLVAEAVDLLQRALGNKKLSEKDFETVPRFLAVLNRLPALKEKIVAAEVKAEGK